MAKKEFSWDHEEIIGVIPESGKVEHDIKICKLNDKQFIVASKRVLKQDGWGIVKNQTFEMGVFEKLVEHVQDYKNHKDFRAGK